MQIEITLISIHVLRVEDDAQRIRPDIEQAYFNPRPPCGGRHRVACLYSSIVDFNPRPPCGGRPVSIKRSSSISRFQSTSSVWRTTAGFTDKARFHRLFQSTSSVWRTTTDGCTCYFPLPDFNPRPPCGGRLTRGTHYNVHLIISIHVLRVEDDQCGEVL